MRLVFKPVLILTTLNLSFFFLHSFLHAREFDEVTVKLYNAFLPFAAVVNNAPARYRLSQDKLLAALRNLLQLHGKLVVKFKFKWLK